MYLEKYTDRFNINDGKMMEKATSIIGSLSEPALWIGIIAAAIMIVGCIQIRKRNNIT